MALVLSGLMSAVQAQPWQSGAWRTDWWRNGATLDMDFAKNRYMVSLTAPVTYTSLTQFISAVSGTFTRAGANETATGDPFYLAANQSFVSRATSTTQLTATGSPFYADASQAFYSRASTGTYFDSSGVMQTAASNVARADYDPLTLAYKGVLIEPARTNYISNSTMQWSGSWPSGWSAVNYGVTPTVVASGTISGMNYIDVQFLGVGDTVSSASSQRYTNIHFGSSVNTSGSTAWATSAYIGYVSGSYPTGTYKSARLLTALATSASYLGELNYAQGSVLNYTGALRRVGTVGTTTSATVFVRPYFQLAYDQGEAVNLTLRFAAPQMEMGTSSTSFIPTTSAPVTRAADVYTQQTASYFDSTGTLKFATAGAARADYHPSTLAYRGILAEPARTNLVKYSSQPGSASWYYQPSYTTITADSAVAPDGTLTADRVSTTAYMVAPGLGVVSDTTYTFSVWLKSPTGLSQGYGLIVEDTVPGDANLLLASSTVVANGSWQRFSISATAPTQTSNFRVSVRNGDYYMWGAQVEAGSSASSYIPTWASTASRAADVYTSGYSGTYFDASGTLRNAPANTPRLDYDPSTSEPKGILIEEARTNYVSRSESGTDITSGNTNPLSFVTATNVLAPNGSGTMLKCVGGNGGSDICRWIINMAPATTYTVSLFMKLAERPYFRLLAYDRSGYIRSSSVNLQNGTIAGCNTTMPGSESIQSLSNGIYRVAMTFTTSSTDLGYGSYFDIRMVPSASSGCSGDNSAADGVSGVYFWGAQLERGAFPTSYIPTSGTAVTRSQDAFVISDTTWVNPTQGSIYIRGTIESPSSGSFWPGLFWMSNNGSTTNAAQQYLTSGGSRWIHQVLVGGTAYGINAPYTLGSELTSMISYEAGDLDGAANGTALAAGNPPSIPAFNRLELGRSRVHRATGYIKRFTYFPTRQPDYSLPDYTR